MRETLDVMLLTSTTYAINKEKLFKNVKTSNFRNENWRP